MGVNGSPINIPMPVQKIFINQDGTVAGIPEGMESSNIEEFAQIKLVKPSIRDVYKGEDGLFRRKDGVKALEDPTVRLENGALEMSNVNVADEMINMIRIEKMFTTQVKLKLNRKTDADVLDWLWKQRYNRNTSMQGEIKRLIRAEIAREKMQ